VIQIFSEHFWVLKWTNIKALLTKLKFPVLANIKVQITNFWVLKNLHQTTHTSAATHSSARTHSMRAKYLLLNLKHRGHVTLEQKHQKMSSLHYHIIQHGQQQQKQHQRHSQWTRYCWHSRRRQIFFQGGTLEISKFFG
jgi:hypothetical protein